MTDTGRMGVDGVRYGFDRFQVFDQIEYRPHVGQRQIHKSLSRMKVVPCGRRFGKSVIGGNDLVVEALYTKAILNSIKAKRREFWIVGPEYSDSEKEFRILYDTLSGLGVPFDKPGTYNNPHTGEMVISLWRGKFRVEAKSAKYPGTLVGEGLHGVVLAEAAKIKERVWSKFLRPTLADHRGWALMTSTPEGKNWFHEQYKRGIDPSDLEWAGWRMPSWINPHVFPDGCTPEALMLLHRMQKPRNDADRMITWEMILSAGVDSEIIDMARDMSAAKFSQEIEADFTDFVGRVFKDFDEETHVGDFEYDPRYPCFAACDYGWTHPFVWLVIQVLPFDKLRVLYEYRVSNRDINEIADDLLQHPLTKHCKVLYPDPASPGDSAVLEKRLRMTVDTNTGGELKHRLESIREALKVAPMHGDAKYRKPRIMFDRSCTGIIDEFGKYRYPETKEEALTMPSEKPMDLDDHGPEALGRFFKGKYGGPLDNVSSITKQSKNSLRGNK
jgi:hypothetical protein